MTLNTQSFRIAFIVISTLINLFVALVIGFSRQLHYLRHLYWVAIAVVNQFCLTQAVVQIAFYLSYNNEVACQIYVFNAGVFYTIILSFLALAALDRYLAIARYEWYKEKVTNRATISLLVFVFIVTYMVVTSPFWTGYKNIKDCKINLTHVHAYLIYDLLLGILCITLHAKIFIRSRKIINEHPSAVSMNCTSAAGKNFHNTNSDPATIEMAIRIRVNYQEYFFTRVSCGYGTSSRGKSEGK